VGICLAARQVNRGKEVSTVSISLEPDITYPSAGNYSPGKLYPEYPFKHLCSGKNPVYDLVRRCLRDAGADLEHYNTADWNPLGQWIKKGDRVFILPNLVTHRHPGESITQFLAKCTHGSIVRALLDYIVIASGSFDHIALGNAPLQSCDYQLVARDTGIAQVTELYRQVANADIGPHDLRCVISRWTRYGALLERRERKPEEVVLVDLGEHSLVDELFRASDTPVQVRVGDYDPRETMSYHSSGKHIYVVNRRVLESDVIVSVPKLKTHQKVGITCALKGTVGAIARKECLAHHRKGGPEDNGDEYPQSTFLRRLASDLADLAANARSDPLSNSLRVISKVLSRALRIGQHGIIGGAWYGNDTAWRMTLDIARILRYARPDGTMSTIPQRQHLALIDGIIAGEGEGPLTPIPRKVGVVLFSPDICAADAACALVMGWDPHRIPLVKNSFLSMPFSLTDNRLDDLYLILNGQRVSALDVLCQFSPPFLAPKGWRGTVEADNITRLTGC